LIAGRIDDPAAISSAILARFNSARAAVTEALFSQPAAIALIHVTPTECEREVSK
jgi:hypothetical protein